MVKRRKIGLIFSDTGKWIGGTYYITNLIQAVDSIEDRNKPLFIILSTNYSDFRLIRKTGYPYLKYRNPATKKRNYVEAIVNKFLRVLFGRDVIIKYLNHKHVDLLYPANFDDCYNRIKIKIFWFPDFQHKHYPEYFTKKEILERDEFLNRVSESTSILVLSSQSAKKDWEMFYGSEKCKTTVLPFAVTHPDISELEISELLRKYDLPNQYFIICNQFWQHKNHIIVLKAAKILKEKNLEYAFVFTGKQEDYRNPHFFNELKHFITEAELERDIRFLGLIDRNDQLKLMSNAIAVIQPSLFEGWSTVIEDAKLLGVPVLASNIEVHKEQLQDPDYFFNPNNPYELVEKLLDLENLVSNSKNKNNYSNAVEIFATKFINIVEMTLNENSIDAT